MVDGMNVPRLLWVAGGREYDDEATMRKVLAPYAEEFWTLVTGAQRGADTKAESLWRKWEMPYIGVPARWAEAGKKAGPQRNRRIATFYKPTRLVWFPGGYGTQSAKDIAKEIGIEVISWEEVHEGLPD